MRGWGFGNVHVTGSLRFSFRHPTGSLYNNYGYFMRGWGFGNVHVTGFGTVFF